MAAFTFLWRQNTERECLEPLDSVTPADVHFWRVDAILERRRQIKAKTMHERRRRHAAWKSQQATLTTATDEGTLSVSLNQERPYTSEADLSVPKP